METYRKWGGANWTCNNCGAQGHASANDFKEGAVRTFFGIAKREIEKGLMVRGLIVECPECRADATIETTTIPPFYGYFVKLIEKKAP